MTYREHHPLCRRCHEAGWHDERSHMCEPCIELMISASLDTLCALLHCAWCLGLCQHMNGPHPIHRVDCGARSGGWIAGRCSCQ